MAKKKSKKSKKNIYSSEHLSFLGILMLFGVFSLYSLMSFFNSTNDYIDNMYASVIDVAPNFDSSMLGVVPSECQTCPPFPVCSDACPVPPGGVGDDATDAVEPPHEVFNDVMSDHENGEAIEALLFEGMISGYADGTFLPDNRINRAELLTILVNAVDADLSGGPYENCFTDVGTEWFAAFVCYAKGQGWVSGDPDGSYRPGDFANKAEALKIVLGAFGFQIPASVTETPFIDVAAGDWFAPYVVVGVDTGVIVSGRFFTPSAEITRGMYVQMVYDAMLYMQLL